MSLSLAYNIARNGLATNSVAASVVSRNISGADNPNASTKTARLVTDVGGGVRVSGIGNVIDTALLESAMESASSASEHAAVQVSLDRLRSTVGDPEAGTSLTALLGDYRNALQTAASAPHDQAALRAVLTASTSLVGALNDGANTIAGVRQDAEAGLDEGVRQLRGMLEEFQGVNGRILAGNAQRRDVTDDIDRRNEIVRGIAELVDVRTSIRGDNDMVLFLANGATLFETVPREVVFDGNGASGSGSGGGALRVDGWPVDSGDDLGGKLGGLLRVRDDIAAKFGRQFDEVARGLIAATAESDQSATPSLPDRAGLFTYAGGPAVPASATAIQGLAASIKVNASVDPSQGGVLARLRDGGISDPGNPSYVSNIAGTAGFSGRLMGLMDQLASSQSFDPAAGLSANGTGLIQFASDSSGWLEGLRSENASQLENKRVLADRTLSAWQNRVGINIDDEMTNLIALERTYQASSRLITSINSMFDALLSATR